MENKAIEQRKKEEFSEEIKEARKTGIVSFDKKNEKEEKSANYTHEFSKPTEIGGKKCKKITFYFEDLNGEDIEAIEAELQSENKYVLSPEVSSIFQTMLAARAARVGADEIRRLKIRDYMKIKNKARDFLLESGYQE